MLIYDRTSVPSVTHPHHSAAERVLDRTFFLEIYRSSITWWPFELACHDYILLVGFLKN